MGNSWFQFREFRIEQGRSAMKVCTDSCIFGALVADRERSFPVQANRILDPGCGTGLLGLMLAQAIPAARITGIELDPGSAEDCRDNFALSGWYERLSLVQADFRSLHSFEDKFDCIICNPPFFLNHLPSTAVSRNAAMHVDQEGLAAWLHFMEGCLAAAGRIWLLLDHQSTEMLGEVADSLSLHVDQRINFLMANGKIRRSVLCFTRDGNPAFHVENQLVFEEKGLISLWAQSLLEPYYLPKAAVHVSF